MKYRAEIDGLRALAVTPVILFHAGLEYFSGGFVGVDIFFVISGYLITSIILSEKEQGIFSLANFYERRARRILPALFLVMLVSLPFAWLWLLPADMKDFSQSMIATSSFASNILFWRESGYWGAANELKPLLHTWSLAVEEQFYIIFPLFVMLMWRFRKRWILSTLATLALISLVISQWGAYEYPSATFFLLPTRVWELAIGSCIAFYFLYRKGSFFALLSNKLLYETLSLLGLLMIGYAVFVFDETTPFPSFYALIPTIGTGLIIIFSSTETLVGRLLSSKILVGIGIISYSAYLWHQPLLAFFRASSLTEPSQFTLVMIAALSFPLAYLSWRYIEKPFRAKGLFSRKQVFSYSIIGSLALITIGLVGHFTNGFNSRETNSEFSAQELERKLKANHGLSVTCEDEFTLSPDCRTSDNPEILIWGDSFAMHLVQGIIASKPDAKIIQMTKSVCGPFFDVAPILEPKYPVSWGKGCLEFTAEVRAWLKANETVKYAILSSPFGQYLSTQNQLLSRNGELLSANTALAIKEFEKTLNELKQQGIKPIVFSPPPASGHNLGKCLEKAEWRGLNIDICDFETSEISRHHSLAHEFLKTIEKNHAVIFLSDFICEDSRCKTRLDDVFIYRDAGHLSIEGAKAIGEKFDFYNLIVEH